MAVSTTQSIWRSGGGDQTRTAYCGNGNMVAQFYIPNVAAASSNTSLLNTAGGVSVILPAGAIVTSIAITATTSTGGTSPTVDFGFTTYTGGVASTQALANEVPSNARGNVTLSSGTAGTSLGLVMSATDLVYLTAGVGASAATSGTITGYINYFVVDPYQGQQNV
jgi:hypothetical protein